MIPHPLKSRRKWPITWKAMDPLSSQIIRMALAIALGLGTAAAEKPKAKTAVAGVSAAKKDEPAAAFEELNFNRTMVIEGKIEKPAVQFTLLKEPPPEKEIRFETSFLQNILKLDRENTFSAGETYGHE